MVMVLLPSIIGPSLKGTPQNWPAVYKGKQSIIRIINVMTIVHWYAILADPFLFTS